MKITPIESPDPFHALRGRSLNLIGRSLAIALVLLLAAVFKPGAALAQPNTLESDLLVGSVRDQFGAPIENATVRADAANITIRGLTDADGTFALAVPSLRAVRSVRVTCRFCRPAVAAGKTAVEGPLVVVMHRYTALISDTPDANDIASLPYAHIESA
ncbi:MAG: carboxypeptidase-like regulatory domain-containing protein, partial [Candidatus Eremiobacteraeota bacterium]|nr:carboxypeptidase-like regulatory domain-containing protein [Candidatus Eremiobacteraeota bacterium]